MVKNKYLTEEEKKKLDFRKFRETKTVTLLAVAVDKLDKIEESTRNTNRETGLILEHQRHVKKNTAIFITIFGIVSGITFAILRVIFGV